MATKMTDQGEHAARKLNGAGNKEQGWMLRMVTPDDADYVSSAWLHGFRDGNLVWGVSNRIYFDHHHSVIMKLVAKSVTLVACMEQNQKDILGFITYEIRGNQLIVHFAQVRKAFRRKGIARAMLKTVLQVEMKGRQLYTFHSHRTEDWVLIYKDHQEELSEFKYNPYLMFS